MRRTGRPRRGGGKESPPLNLASGGGNSRGRRAPPSPTRLLPQEEKHQGRSGGTEPDRSASQDAVSAPTAAVFLLRGLQQSLGRQLPGGASPHAMKRGGPGRKGTKSDPQRQAKRDRLAHEFGEWQDWLRDALRETGFFIARTDSKIWLTLIMAAVAGILHWYHITTLFENDRHFSHLSTLEREMAFRTEMSTRVMWTPPLRESFSYPFLVVQMLLLTYILRTQNVNRRSLIALSVSNVLFMLPWQFAQFVLLTQVASVFGVYILGFIDSAKLQKILYAHMVSLTVCFVFMFGNSMLMTSYYAAFLIVSWSILELGPKYLKLYTKNIPLWALEGFSCLFGTIILKFLMCLIFGISDDVHISNLLKAKLTGYRDFDTSMYTCAVEFDFMEKETPVRYMKTLLLPVVLILFSVIVVKAFQYVMLKEKSSERQEYYFNQGEIVYHALQLLFFTILAILIMRLKLFLTPHMCIMASLICSKQLFGWVFYKIQPGTLVLTILAMMAFEGIANLQKEWSIVGEFSNLPQEELLLWIKANTKPDAVFAGAMPTMASVKLSAQRPIVNHPHYEDAGLRARTKIVYSMYSRKPAKEVKRELLKMGVNYYILEDSWCLRRTKPGCSMPEIWDIEDLANAGKIPLCNLMCKDSRPYFRTVFNNNIFKVLEVTRE
ncbi:probable C-mannosyltransferase DPY19L1 isoform X5 [Crotalus tigris]|uniref:probable C-mannosyltransferase DPY19L1 isoform X5 n=1 Tax=Crotalus tigris TaxID=88082 RepID=UPI00192F43D5|nr:probable C-mannosyltransferase DPY19L1 isoform X5 [Crotalus tigris]